MSIVTSLLDNDFYAFTMGQVIWQHKPEAVVRYQFINRQAGSLAEYISVDELQAELDAYRDLRFTAEELAYLDSLNLFGQDYLAALAESTRPRAIAEITNGQLTVGTIGPWWQAVLWETPALAMITELYHRALLRRDGISLAQAEAIGQQKLESKIRLLQTVPGLKFSEFGSRRRFSRSWQREVVQRLQQALPQQLTGTSNVLLAKELGLAPIGTMAHQLFMGWTALEVAADTTNPLAAAQQQVLDVWEETYGGKLNVFLTDTYRTGFALENLDPEQAQRWAGMRQDSGDPIAYGEELLAWYAEHDIDPSDHFLLCSDGLDVPKAIAIYRHFAGRLDTRFGIGTNLVNDLVHPGLNAVWKPVSINDLPVVKLSDEPGKFTGTPQAIAYYLKESGHPETETYLQQHHAVTGASTDAPFFFTNNLSVRKCSCRNDYKNNVLRAGL